MKKKVQNKQDTLEAGKSDLWKLRHSAEHVLHQAIKELYPSIHLAMGPATDDGFYFDFDATPEGRDAAHISDSDFLRIEQRMQELIAGNLPITRQEISIAEARKLFADNPYKQEWIDQIEQKGEMATVYWTGEPEAKGSMVDLCAGPHVSSTSKIKAFKLLSLAGAYWHGDENNKMLTRIYGTAFSSQKELDNFLYLQAEAIKRDHRKLGLELDLFTFSDLVGAGLPLWTPRGMIMRKLLEDFEWELRSKKGFERVEIPHITKKDLYQISGHWDKFSDELFKITTREGHELVMKPMNCPHHTQIFDRKAHSYREMPQRYANTTMVYRDEQTGELSGLSRVRAITQDDSHVFCRQSQIKTEANALWDIIDDFYGPHGFETWVRLSLRDPDQQELYLGDEKTWEGAENQLRELAAERGIEVVEAIGEAAFYGPKLDFMGRDSLGREWQLATIQLDFNMPERFNLNCINEQGEKERVTMLHYAVMGSIERFMSILIEHYAGAFPVWLSPVQVKVLPITDAHSEYAKTVVSKLAAAGVRVELDDRSERLQAKIRDAQLEKIPYMLVVGDKEAAEQTVAVRSRDTKSQEVLSLNEFIKKIAHYVIIRSAY